jgi:S-methylmethionine-dependent homocysteine/selenocysteine methylase
VDLLLIETMNTAREAAAAANAARQTGLPFGVSFVCGEDGLLLSGESLAEAVRAAEVYGPAFLGVNCIPALSLQKALKDLGHSSDLPLAAYGNIGHSDHFQVWEDTQDHDLKDYADLCAQWLSSGVRLIGGCCGSNPEHIAALAETLNKETL